MQEKKKIIWIEILRIIACFAVIVLHMGSQHFRDIPVDSFNWKVTNVYHGITRFAVDCFVMISGSLYLNASRNWTPRKVMKTFLTVGVSFVFWQFFYAVFRLVKAGDVALFSVTAFKRICIMMSQSYFHLWYMPMFLGLILMTPFIWKIVNGDKGKQWSEFFIALFIVFNILPNTLDDFSFPYKQYIVEIINLININFVTGYVGYFILGDYLMKYPISRKIETIIYILGVFLTGCSVYLCQVHSIQSGTAIQVFYENFTLTVFLMSAGMFLFCKNHISRIKWNVRIENAIAVLGSHTFGIYLLHVLVRDLLEMANIHSLCFNPVVSIPVISIAIFVIGFLIVAVLKKIPLVGKWIV